MGIRGVWGDVKEEYGCNVAHPHGILTNKMVVPPLLLAFGCWYPARGWGRGYGLFKLKCWSVLQNLVPYMWQLVLA